MTKALRWNMAILITAAIAISYFDRQTLPIAIRAIQQEIPVTNGQFSHLQAAFLAAYALMYAGSGKLIDVLGTRRGFLVIMIWWSLACASQGLGDQRADAGGGSVSAGHGRGRRVSCCDQSDGGVVPCQRALDRDGTDERGHRRWSCCRAATDCTYAGAPELALGFLSGRHGWLGVDRLVGQGLSTRRNAPAPRAPRKEKSWQKCWQRQGKEHAVGQVDRPVSATRRFADLVFAKFLSDAAWYFYIFWLPKYLYDVHHFDTKQVGYYAWIPYAAAGVGSLLGGWFSSRLIQRGVSVNLVAQACARPERGGYAVDLAGATCPGGVRDCDLQPCVRRTAIVVDAGDDTALRSCSIKRGGIVRRAGWIWRRDGRHRFRTCRWKTARSADSVTVRCLEL